MRRISNARIPTIGFFDQICMVKDNNFMLHSDECGEEYIATGIRLIKM